MAPKILKYPEENMLKALGEVSRGKPIATAAKENGVPLSSLYYKVKGKRPVERRMGPDTVLTKEEEQHLQNWIITVSKAGFPVSKTELLDSVQRLLTDMGRTTIFNENRPGRKWFQSFLKRHPSISQRVAQNLTISRASITSQQLLEWSSSVFNYLRENNLNDILSDPNRVFNGDESAFFFNPKGSKVLANKGDKTVYQQINADEKECITVLVTANAAGILAPPLVVFRYERIPADIADSIPPFWGIGKSESGWMNGALFFEFITNVFHPWLIGNKIPLPIILFIDGHVSHLTLHTSEFCNKNGIILVALLPNATHILQPMDVAVFRSLKRKWQEKVHKWRLENINSKPILKKKDFSPLLKLALDEITSSTIQNGFRKCGLVPWNPEEVLNTLAGKNVPIEETGKNVPIEETGKNVPIEETGKSVSIGEKTSQDVPINDTKIALSVLEDIIGLEKVESFKGTTSTWQGQLEDQSLYEVWRAMTTKIMGQDHLQQDTKEMEECIPQLCAPPGQETPSQTTSADIPSPFKRALFWPDRQEVKNKRRREIFPSVVTSERWREYNKNKITKKLEMENAKQKRAEEREKKKLKLKHREEFKKKKESYGKRKRTKSPISKG